MRDEARRLAAADQDGQALVEFALVIPLLLILIIGIFEFGRAWNAYQVITDAAREGARLAVIDRDGTDSMAVVNVVREALGNAALDPDNATITVQPNPDDADRGDATRVSIAYPYEFVFLGPLLGWTTGQSSITLGTSFVMRQE